jgi:hypothetical protein
MRESKQMGILGKKEEENTAFYEQFPVIPDNET